MKIMIDLPKSEHDLLNELIKNTGISAAPKLSKQHIIRAMIRFIPQLKPFDVKGVRTEDEFFDKLIEKLKKIKYRSYIQGSAKPY